MARGEDPRPTPAQHFEVKERFTGLITDRASQQALLVKHLKPVLRQLIANQMFGLQTFQLLAAGVFIESTLCSEVASLFSSLFNTRRERGLLAPGWFCGPSVASGFGGNIQRLEICAYHATKVG